MPVEVNHRELFKYLENRDPAARFDHPREQEIITMAAAGLWQERPPVTGTFQVTPGAPIGYFPDGQEIYSLRESGQPQVEFNYIQSSVLNPADLLGLVTQGLNLKAKGSVNTLVAPYLFQQRTERKVIGAGVKHGFESHDELAVLEAVVSGLSQAYSRGLITVESHSLGLEYWGLKHNLPVLSLSALPILIDEAWAAGLIDTRLKPVVAGADLGGRMLVNMVTEAFGTAAVILGDKKRERVFNREAIRAVAGNQVILPDDIISSGTTVFKALDQLFEAGAVSGLILAPHTRISERLLNGLNKYQGRVSLVTTDTLPVAQDLVERVNNHPHVHTTSLDKNLAAVISLDIQGEWQDVITNPRTQQKLREVSGFGVAPGYVPKFRQPADATITA